MRGGSTLRGTIASGHGEVVCGSLREGLLLRAHISGDGGNVNRGTVLDHKGRRWVCLFEVDRYWFAAPLLVDSSDALASLRRPTPEQAEREQLQASISTGVTAVDTLAPIGRGQSMLFFGSEGTGKSSLASEIMEHSLHMGSFDKVNVLRAVGGGETLAKTLCDVRCECCLGSSSLCTVTHFCLQDTLCSPCTQREHLRTGTKAAQTPHFALEYARL